MSNVKHTRSAAPVVPAPADPSQGAGRADDVTDTRATVRPARRGHIGLARLSSNSVQRTVAGADHTSLLDNEAMSANSSRAIRDVVSAVRTGTPLRA